MQKEEITNTLLSLIQKDFPLCEKPFEELGKKLNISEDKVLEILKKQKEQNIIRQISPIFDTKKLGYSSSLVAFVVDEEDIDDAVDIINSHPGISHNYERNHKFNIWFTIAVEKNSHFGLEKTVELLAKLTKAKDFIILPTLKMFKIQVKLNTTGKDEKKEKVAKKTFKKMDITSYHEKIIEKTQYDLPIKSKPFEDMVKELGLTYDELFETLKEFKDAGVMRRFAAILNHRKAGFSANAMVVWDVDEEKGEEIGKTAASFSAVSHCYLRPKYPNWPFNLFTMIHGKTTEDTNSVIEDIANEIDFKDKMPLYSTREFKKKRIIYFTDDFNKWEERYL